MNRRDVVRLSLVMVCAFVMMVTSIGSVAAKSESGLSPDPNRGLYALWYQNKSYRQEIVDLPYIVGGQLVIQWGELHTAPHKFDFSKLDKELARLSSEGLVFTIQFNGSKKPEWLFDVVPYHPKKLSHQIANKQGSLMWWHPTYMSYHSEFLEAVSAHIKKSAYCDNIIGIRMSPNAFGTEHTKLSAEYVDLQQWIVPRGVDKSVELKPWSRGVANSYVAGVVRDYVKYFSDFISVFVRNDIPLELEQELKQEFDSGELSWFHTSSEVEPRGSSGSLKYGRFEDYCKSGKGYGFAEPWASAWGDHGSQTDHRYFSPAQSNYWRLLNDLHCGISFIGIYADDLQVAINGKYSYPGRTPLPANSALQQEFDQAFRFAFKYAGTHLDPSTAPGAWIAFRENDKTLEKNVREKNPVITRLNSDYTFMMERTKDESVGLGVTLIGPDAQRYGAFARMLSAGKSMSVEANGEFLRSLKGSGAVVRLIYLDADGAIGLDIGGESRKIKLKGSGSWRVYEVKVSGDHLASGGDITISSTKGDIYLHMLEIERK